MIRAWVCIALWLASPQTHASDCAEPNLDPRRLDQRLDEARRALDDTQLSAARGALAKVGSSLPCLTSVVDPQAFARFARLMSEVAFYRQEEAAALRWGHAAQLADPAGAWTGLPDSHPLRQRLATAELPPVGGPEGFGLAAPDGGAIYLNGELTRVPEAHAEVPYLVQLVDARAEVIAAYWQDGAAFPEQILVAGAGPTPDPVWQRPDAPLPRPERARPGGRFPVAPVLVGGALAATSVASYALASSAHASLPDQTTPEGLTRARSQANAFVLVSGIAAAGAVGVGIGGVLLSPTGATWTVRF